MRILFAAAVFWQPFFAHAEDISSRDTAGVEQSRFESQSSFEKKARSFRKKVSDQIVSREKEESIEPAAEGPFFLIREVKIQGNKSLSTAEFKDILEPILNRDVSLQELREKADQIKKRYHQRGYVAAYVYVPPQKITDHVVTFQVIEGRLGRITLIGQKWFSEKILRRQIHSKSGPLRFENLKQDMDRLNRHRDIEARAVLKEGVEAETTDVEINVKDHFPWHLGGDVNNQGTPNTGKTRWGTSLSWTNLFGIMAEVAGRFQIGRRVWGVGANADVPISSKGTKLDFGYTHSHVKVGGDFRDLNIQGDATTYSLSLTQPVIENQHFEAAVNAGLDWKSVENRLLGSVSGRDEFRIFHPGLDFSFSDPWGKTQTSQNFYFAFDRFLGASHKNNSQATRANTGGQFFVYRGSLIRAQPLAAGLLFSFRGNVQLSPDRLAPSEQLNLGGAFSVRGYPESEFLADSGGYFTTELLVPSYFFPKNWKLPRGSEALRDQVQGVGFFDFGGGHNQHALSGEDRDRTLASVGLGVRVHLTQHLFARFEWGMPTGTAPANGSHGAFHFGVSGELF